MALTLALIYPNRDFFKLLELYGAEVNDNAAVDNLVFGTATTLFAPTNEAMAKLSTRVLNALKSSTQTLKQVRLAQRVNHFYII